MRGRAVIAALLLAEVAEADAVGEPLRTCEEMRRNCGVGYVSTPQRQVADLTGCLGWRRTAPEGVWKLSEVSAPGAFRRAARARCDLPIASFLRTRESRYISTF